MNDVQLPVALCRNADEIAQFIAGVTGKAVTPTEVAEFVAGMPRPAKPPQLPSEEQPEATSESRNLFLLPLGMCLREWMRQDIGDGTLEFEELYRVRCRQMGRLLRAILRGKPDKDALCPKKNAG